MYGGMSKMSLGNGLGDFMEAYVFNVDERVNLNVVYSGLSMVGLLKNKVLCLHVHVSCVYYNNISNKVLYSTKACHNFTLKEFKIHQKCHTS